MKCIFISVRTGSSRLPQKAILNICGKPTIQYLIENVKKSKLADKIVLCTTLEKNDDILCDIATNNNIEYFRGSTEDKLLRWRGACQKYDVDFFVNIDGDDIFFDFGLADLVFQQHLKSGVDFIDGQGLYNDVYGISVNGIETVCKNKKNTDTEFIKLYFENIKHLIRSEKLINVPTKYHKKQVRMTLDYEEDLKFFETIISHLADKELTFENINSYIQNNSEVTKINWFREQNWIDNQNKMIDKINKGNV